MRFSSFVIKAWLHQSGYNTLLKFLFLVLSAKKKILSVQFLLLLDFAAYKKKQIVISFSYCPKYINSIKKRKQNRSKNMFIGFCRRKLNKGKLDEINSELAQR
jgi:hypothetical protein